MRDRARSRERGVLPGDPARHAAATRRRAARIAERTPTRRVHPVPFSRGSASASGDPRGPEEALPSGAWSSLLLLVIGSGDGFLHGPFETAFAPLGNFHDQGDALAGLF